MDERTEFQQAQIKLHIQRFTNYLQDAYDWLTTSQFDASVIAYSNYFNPEDQTIVASAFKALLSIPVATEGPNFKIICVPADNDACKAFIADPSCDESDNGNSPSSIIIDTDSDKIALAAADNSPESLAYAPDNVQAGDPREMRICPAFFTENEATRAIPTTPAEMAVFCDNPGALYALWETGTHTLVHEVTHLHTFGLLAGLEPTVSLQNEDIPAYQYHGAVDFVDSSPISARRLKVDPEDEFTTVKNAESYAAFALGR